jgi:hypothetical protein
MSDEKETERFRELFGGGPTDEDRERWAKEKAEIDAVTADLEAKYADRGLKFTVSFAGAMPVQAFGYVDGMRFYFRFRGNSASLRVGPFDQAFEDLHYHRMAEQHDGFIKRAEEALAAGTGTEQDVSMAKFSKNIENRAKADDDNYYPQVVKKRSHCVGPDPDNMWAGYLTAEEDFMIFSKLMDTMEEVPESEWVDPWTLRWLNHENVLPSS